MKLLDTFQSETANSMFDPQYHQVEKSIFVRVRADNVSPKQLREFHQTLRNQMRRAVLHGMYFHSHIHMKINNSRILVRQNVADIGPVLEFASCGIQTVVFANGNLSVSTNLWDQSARENVFPRIVDACSNYNTERLFSDYWLLTLWERQNAVKRLIMGVPRASTLTVDMLESAFHGINEVDFPAANGNKMDIAEWVKKARSEIYQVGYPWKVEHASCGSECRIVADLGEVDLAEYVGARDLLLRIVRDAESKGVWVSFTFLGIVETHPFSINTIDELHYGAATATSISA